MWIIVGGVVAGLAIYCVAKWAAWAWLAHKLLEEKEKWRGS